MYGKAMLVLNGNVLLWKRKCDNYVGIEEAI